MPFLLSRGGANVPAEVQRWQYFLRKRDFAPGSIDADFGINTESATRRFQAREGLAQTGELDERTLQKAQDLGYTIVPDDYYAKRAGPGFPAEPAGLSSPSNASRNATFTCFNFLQRPLAQRPDREAIVQKGSCDGGVSDWVAAHIVNIEVPQLKFARGFGGRVSCHRKAAPVIKALFEKWEQDDLLHLIISYEGCFVPRYKRKKAPPGSGGHGLRRSADVPRLSNHSFGSAFDINRVDNDLGKVPAVCGRRGSVRELVASANALGVYWGGHFANLDGMHFEISKLP